MTDHLGWFAGGIVLAQAMFHLLCGMSGSSSQTTFATPSSKLFSGCIVNVLRRMAGLLLAWLLLARVVDVADEVRG